MHLYISYVYQNKQQFFPLAVIINWSFVNEMGCLPCEVIIEFLNIKKKFVFQSITLL
jgi:hypothetical protein